MRVKNKVSITEVKNKSGTTSFRVDMGTVNGRRKFKQFKSRVEADTFAHQCNVNIEVKNIAALGDISEVMVHRYEFLNSYNRLKEIGATISEATDYYIKYARPSNGKIAISELIKEFIKEKTRIGCSQKYLGSITRFDLHIFRQYFGDETNLSDITTEQFSKYLYSKTTLNPVSKLSHFRVISMLFNYALKKSYVTRNPIIEVEPPRQVGNLGHTIEINPVLENVRGYAGH